jgi:diaminopimelate epimerase
VKELHVLKGHGTENDFVLIPDLSDELDLTDALVRALCDRHAGVGADGVLRVVRSEHVASAAATAAEAPFFMDYRNADGSVAEMCGNGVRVFTRYLAAAGLIDGQTVVATRGGPRPVRIEDDATISVEMGSPVLLDVRPEVSTADSALRFAGFALNVPNPHVVVAVPGLGALGALDLARAPTVTPALPDGQNVEFVVRTGVDRIAVRVHERGVGETRSCGTGICAAVVATAVRDGLGPVDNLRWWVDVPGGQCSVAWRPDGSLRLRGPAVLIGELELDSGWLARVG